MMVIYDRRVAVALSGAAPIEIPMREIRSATTERACALQFAIATAAGVEQFRLNGESVFRLRQITLDWAEPPLERLTRRR